METFWDTYMGQKKIETRAECQRLYVRETNFWLDFPRIKREKSNQEYQKTFITSLEAGVSDTYSFEQVTVRPKFVTENR